MKELVKKLLRESLLSETLTDVDIDIDLLYDKFFRSDIEEINKTGIVTENMFLAYETSTEIFQSEECKRAHKINPCKIYINGKHNGYSPSMKTITISINDNAISHAMDFNGNLKDAMNYLSDENLKKSFIKEFTENKIKGSANHELAHWLDDTFHNQYIKKTLEKALEVGSKDFKGIPIDSTSLEIQGQIHNIKQSYRLYKDIWDTLTFDELKEIVPTIGVVSRKLGWDIREKWVKALKKRMYREGLLGKNMVNN